MRTRSSSTEPDGCKCNSLPGQAARPAAPCWLKLPRLFRKPPVQDTIRPGHPSTTDGTPPEKEEQPAPVILTFEQNLERQHFHEASQLLIDREERLFEDTAEVNELSSDQEESVNKLSADYRALEGRVRQTLMNSFYVSTEALTSAVQAVLLQDKQDQMWKQKGKTPPSWRPGAWKELHDTTLYRMLKDRIHNSTTPPLANQQEQSSVTTDIHTKGRQLKDDLLLVVGVVKTCYPPEMDICNFYAKQYHKIFSSKLRKIADFGLEDKDCTFLLRWVNEFYPGILENPELANEIDVESLGKLLPQHLLEPLEEQYLSKQQSELMTYISRILEEEKQIWSNGEEPKREDDCYVSPVAYDIIQFINGMVTSSEKVVGDLQKAQRITSKLNSLMQSFKMFQEEVMKQNKPNSKATIKATLGCVEEFSDVLFKHTHLLREDVQQNCLLILKEMKEAAHTYLLSPAHEALRPQYRKLGTNDWLNQPLFDRLLLSIQQEVEELQGTKESCHKELISQFHQEVTVEYVKRLLKGEVKLKDKERQFQAYTTVRDNAESLHKFFIKMGSKEGWLKEILIKIAEVLKLQDLPAIQMQVASLGSAFPDMSEKHVSSLLKLKTNVSRADRRTVKATLADTLRETTIVGARSFFSKVQVK
ncbi:tumor necrosis factor alpha-induced protein 2-like isoform X2 [Echeneis naucrates]|nr:tumor necrosis factor alpha-induced protein 2-like isoform X2 [Echeneis naucrates]